MDAIEEEIPLDDVPTDAVPLPEISPAKKLPIYFEEANDYAPFDSGSPFSISLSTDTQS